MDDFLVIDAVHKSFGAHRALDGVHLSIREGEIFSLLGPSGCGKTTLLRLLAGFDTPDSGRIHLAGTDLTRLPPERRPVNTVFQNYALFPHLNVRDNLAFGPRLAGWHRSQTREAVDRMLTLVRLENHADHLPAQLSGGQKQRAALARALINRPRLLLLDEPLAALDLKLRQHLLVELAALHREVGTTFLYITHDQTEAMSLSHRIAVMREGRIEQVDTPEQLYQQPASAFVAAFIGDTNLVEGRLEDAGVRLAGGLIAPLPGATPTIPGDNVRLSIRPEHVLLRAATAPSPWRIAETVYGGAFTRYWVEGDGQRWLAQQSGPPTLARGATVSLELEPAGIRLLPATSS
jgi:spermidine/putrescine transport system ATP-binding protein